MKDSYQINIYSPRNRSRLEDSPDKSAELSKSLLAKDEEHLNFLKTLYFILSILSIFLSFFSYYTWTLSKSYSILVLSLVSLLSTASGILGVLGSFKGIKDLKYRHLILAGEKEGQGKNFLMVSFFLMLLTFTLFLVFGSHALFYSERTASYLQATYLGTTEELQSNFKSIMLLIMICGYTAYLLIIVKLFIIHFAFLLSLLYDSIDRIFEILNLNLLNLGLGMIYITIYCLKYHSHLKFLANIPINTLYSIIGVSLSLCLICLIGFFTVRSQTIKLVRFYLLSNFFMIITCALCATVSINSTHLFREGLSEKCYDFMAIVNQDYLRELGCENKYLNLTNNENNGCENGNMRVVWENGGNEEFGCLNTMCCDVLITDAKTKFDYLGICAGAAVGVICLALWACYYIWSKLNSNLANRHIIDRKLLTWALLAPVFTSWIIFYCIPDPPYLPPYLSLEAKVKDPGFVDPRWLDPEWRYNSFSIISEFPKSKDQFEYELLINTENGVINIDPYISGEYDLVLNSLQKLQFLPICRNKEHFVSVQVSKKDASGISSVLDFSSSFLSGNQLEIIGNFYPKDTLVSYKGDCIGIEVNENKFKVLAESHFFRTSSLEVLHFEYPGYLPVSRTITIGGFPRFPYSIPPTILIKPSEPSRFTIKVYSLSDDPINSFIISLRTGYQNFTGPSVSFNFSSNEGIFVLEKQIYSITTSSEGFKTDYSEIIDKNTLNVFLTPNNFANSEIRVVLTWTGELDLDLRAKFKYSKDFDCDIAGFSKICGSASLNFMSKSGINAEEISLNKVASSHYLFYVKEYKTDKTRLIEAGATIKIYIKSLETPLVMLGQQDEYSYQVSPDEYKIWLAFCFDGSSGVSSLAPIQSYMSINHIKESLQICSQFYGDPQNNTIPLVYENLKFPQNITIK